MRAQVLTFDGAEELDVVAPVEVLNLADKLSGGALPTTLVTTGAPATVTCMHGTRIEVATGWSPEDADVLVVPGGDYADPNGPGVHRLIADEEFLGRLAAAAVLPVAICTGTMVLSAAGMTTGRNVATHPLARADLATRGATVRTARVVDDGDLISAGGIASGLDASLWLVERFLGPELAHRVETVLDYERRGTVWRRER